MYQRIKQGKKEVFNRFFCYSQKRGFTLVEAIVTVALMAIVVAAIFSFFFFQTNTFSRGSDRSEIQSEIRLASDFISKELRYATDVSISAPADPSQYNRIYIANNKLMYQPAGGPEVEKSSAIFDPTDFTVNLSGSIDIFTATFSLNGTKNKSEYNIDSSVNLKNVTTLTISDGNQIYYKSPPLLNLITPSVSPTPSVSISPSPSPSGTPTITASPTPTPVPIALAISPSIPGSIIKGQSTGILIMTASGGNGTYSFSFTNGGWKTVSVGTQSNSKSLELIAPTSNPTETLTFTIHITSGGITNSFTYNTIKTAS